MKTKKLVQFISLNFSVFVNNIDLNCIYFNLPSWHVTLVDYYFNVQWNVHMFSLVFHAGIHVLFNADCTWFLPFETPESTILSIAYDHLLYNLKLLQILWILPVARMIIKRWIDYRYSCTHVYCSKKVSFAK